MITAIKFVTIFFVLFIDERVKARVLEKIIDMELTSENTNLKIQDTKSALKVKNSTNIKIQNSGVEKTNINHDLSIENLNVEENSNLNIEISKYNHSKFRHSLHLSRDHLLEIEKIDNHFKNHKHKKRHSVYHRNWRQIFDVDVSKVQNRSLCNYTVTQFDISDDNIMPRDLVEITCNNNVIGSDCQLTGGTYCCMQTYSTIQVLSKKGTTKRRRINTGCICALQFFAMANDTDNTNSYLND